MSIAARLVCTILIACAGVGAVATSAGSETRVGKGRSTQEFDVADKSSCPADAQKAAKDLWPMASSFGAQVRRLKGKHPCGAWVTCERVYPSKDWRCLWDDKAGRS